MIQWLKRWFIRPKKCWYCRNPLDENYATVELKVRSVIAGTTTRIPLDVCSQCAEYFENRKLDDTL